MSGEVGKETEEAAPRGRSFYLVYRRAENATVRVPLDEGRDVVFGRGDDVDVLVDDTRVSRRHATVRRSRVGVQLRDLGSRNGTAIGGETLRGAQRELGAGDVFIVGSLEVTVAAASSSFVVADKAMRKLYAAALGVAKRRAPVLLLGEPGVGKALLARVIHEASARAGKPFVQVDCGGAAATRELLFGDAGGEAKSLVAAAHQGTLLLEEIADLDRETQARLFDLLQPHTTGGRAGAHATRDVRVVCSSSADLRDAVRSGRLDAKLYELLGTRALTVPPLRDRKSEIPVLVEHFLRQVAEHRGDASAYVADAAMDRLVAYAWPRNVSDLRDVLEMALALSDDGRVTTAELPETLGAPSDDAPAASPTQPPSAAAGRAGGETLWVAPSGDSFRVGHGAPVSLARSGTLRRLLLCLARHREIGLDEAVSSDELFAAGWPGERITDQSARGRLRTAIWTLRRAGLGDLLLTREQGYALAPHVVIAWA